MTWGDLVNNNSEFSMFYRYIVVYIEEGGIRYGVQLNGIHVGAENKIIKDGFYTIDPVGNGGSDN
jgi:hypothetical protein